MTTQHNVDSRQGGEDICLPSASARIPSRDGNEAYLQRVEQYEQEGVLREEPDSAFLAVLLAELFRIACSLEGELQAALDDNSSYPDNLRAEREVERYLRAVRRIDRYVRLEIR